MEKKLQIINIEDYAMTAETIQRQVNTIQNVMNQVMKSGEHYGKIPGCGNKPTLLKPGAEKLSITFRLAPSYEIKRNDLPGGHREYEVICTLTHISLGYIVGQGVGSCSSMEGKYRFRVGEGELTEIAVPKKYWDSRDINILKNLANEHGIEGDKFTTKKNDFGKWVVATYGERVEHDNPADYYNTILKMAKKRAHVDAVLTATAASDIFTQDIEDMPEVIPQSKDILSPKRKLFDALKNEKLTNAEMEDFIKFICACYSVMNLNDEQYEETLKNLKSNISEWKDAKNQSSDINM